MELIPKYKPSILLINTSNTVTDVLFKNLLENCFAVLSGSTEIHNINSLCGSKPDVVKEIYCALLYLCTECVRNQLTSDELLQLLLNTCSFNQAKSNIFVDLYEKHKLNVEISLLNIGQHLPHITDVKWKIDYIVKTNILDESNGPLFRISLSTEYFDSEGQNKKMKNVNFSCNSQELQDLVYKLKDAVRHCQRIATEH